MAVGEAQVGDWHRILLSRSRCLPHVPLLQVSGHTRGSRKGAPFSSLSFKCLHEECCGGRWKRGICIAQAEPHWPARPSHRLEALSAPSCGPLSEHHCPCNRVPSGQASSYLAHYSTVALPVPRPTPSLLHLRQARAHTVVRAHNYSLRSRAFPVLRQIHYFNTITTRTTRFYLAINTPHSPPAAHSSSRRNLFCFRSLQQPTTDTNRRTSRLLYKLPAQASRPYP
ncbi:hypothetical protein VTI74DRAFT_8456 [Chaetomium olivicolor]